MTRERHNVALKHETNQCKMPKGMKLFPHLANKHAYIYIFVVAGVMMKVLSLPSCHFSFSLLCYNTFAAAQQQSWTFSQHGNCLLLTSLIYFLVFLYFFPSLFLLPLVPCRTGPKYIFSIHIIHLYIYKI